MHAADWTTEMACAVAEWTTEMVCAIAANHRIESVFKSSDVLVRFICSRTK